MQKFSLEVLRYEAEDVIATSASSICTNPVMHFVLTSSDLVQHSGSTKIFDLKPTVVAYMNDGSGLLAPGDPVGSTRYFIYNGAGGNPLTAESSYYVLDPNKTNNQLIPCKGDHLMPN